MIQVVGKWAMGLAMITGMIWRSDTMEQIKYANQEVSIGEFKICLIQDARIQLSIAELSGIEQKEASRLIGGWELAWTPVNAYLVRTPKKVLLIDAGIGKHPEEDSGHLPEGLKYAGTDPAKVDVVFITHFHFDHIGGLASPDGRRLFPNAIIRVPKAEHDYWMGDPSSIPLSQKERAAKIRAIFAPYIAADAYRPFSPNDNLGPGIKALPSYGHTPGHTSYSFSSEGKELWCIGDLIHFSAIQFDLPSVGVHFDADGAKAVAARLACFRRAADLQVILAGAHLQTMVRVEKKGKGFTVRSAGI